MIEHRSWLVVACALIVAYCSLTTAQIVYKWTDDHGVVHFADAPPPNVKAETLHLSAPSQVVPQGPEGVPRSPGPQAGATGTDVTVTPQGPARVIVLSRNTRRTGTTQLHIVGEVKNFGGAAADHVTVTITAVEENQRKPCLHLQTAVTPSTLAYGESGKFDADIDDPCLYGKPNVDVVPAWE